MGAEFERLRAMTWGDRATRVRHWIVPSRTTMTVHDPRAADGTPQLVRAHVVRWGRRARRLPGAVRQWQQARRRLGRLAFRPWTSWTLLARLILAGVFVVSAVAKWRDEAGARQAVADFGVPVPPRGPGVGSTGASRARLRAAAAEHGLGRDGRGTAGGRAARSASRWGSSSR